VLTRLIPLRKCRCLRETLTGVSSILEDADGQLWLDSLRRELFESSTAAGSRSPAIAMTLQITKSLAENRTNHAHAGIAKATSGLGLALPSRTTLTEAAAVSALPFSMQRIPTTR